jgi:anti-sigma B factor antagonist
MRIQVGEKLIDYGPFAMPGPSPSVVDRQVQGVGVIDLAGPLVAESPVDALHDRIRQLLNEGVKNFAINLAEVPYADSYGLGCLAGAYNLIAEAGGRIKFFAASERLVRTLERLRLDTVFELFQDEATALSSFH